MEAIDLNANLRDKVGKGSARFARKNNLIPAVIYGNKEKPIAISLEKKEWYILMQKPGIFGQLTKENVFNEIIYYWPLFLAVLIGGLFGNYLNLKIFSNRLLAFITSLLVIFVAMRIGYKIFI